MAAPGDDQYAGLAADYHWLYDAFSLRVGTRTPGVQATIRDLPPGAAVLDAACGVGIDAKALHRRGFRVTATDASGGMVEECRARLAVEGVHVAVDRCEWEDLPRRFHSEFDAVLCTGNSLAHAPSIDSRRAALAGLAGVLTPGGTLVLDSQDWELLHRRGSHRDDDPLVVERDGHRTTRHFDWQVPERFGDPVTLTLSLTVDGGPGATHTVAFCPFARADLLDELVAIGLTDTEVVQNPGDDRYAVVARQ